MSIPEEFVISGETYKNTITEDARINRCDLNSEFERQGEKFRWWATLYELSADEELELKQELSRVYARLDAQARLDMESAGVRATEKKVENTVITHPKYVESQREYNAAKCQTGLLKAAMSAMIQRKDMLIQLGAAYRAEGVADIALREQAVRDMASR
jgi:hypothetical protein